MLGRTFKNLGRLRQITVVIARHGLGHVQERRQERRRHGPKDGATAADRAGLESSAWRFRAVLEDLGTTFVKFGQLLSSRADLLPPEFIRALEGLQDHVPAMPWEDVQQVMLEGLGASPEELFASIDREPLASASVAQVHRATTHDGREVAVKVQRRNIRQQILSDLDLLRYLAHIAQAIIEESGMVTPRAVVQEFEGMLLAELDFNREAQNMRRFAKNLQGQERPYVVPDVFEALSSRTVLTMSFIEGTKLAQVEDPQQRKKLAEHIVQAAFEQIFVDGVFHADPHPGNLIVLPDGRLGLIDFGSVGEISYAMRELLVVLVVAVGTRDAETVARLLYRSGITEERVMLHELRDACASLFDEYLRDMSTLAGIEATQLMTELFALAAHFKIRIPSEYAVIGRASATIEGILRNLDPNLEVLETTKPYVRRLIEDQFRAPHLEDEALKHLLRARTFMRELPMLASQILMDLEAGRFQVHIDSPKLDNLARSIDSLAVTLFAAMVAAALVAGSMFALAAYDFELWGVPILPIVGLYLASILFGAAIGRYLLAPRLRKFSVGRWLARWRRRR